MKYLFLFLFIFVFSFRAYADITTGLLAWWRFDEGSGTTAIDSSSGGKTGTLENSPGYVTGKIGPYALSFNGTTQYVDSSNFADNLSNFTVSCWFNTTSSSSQLAQVMVSKASAGGVYSGAGWFLFMINGGYFGGGTAANEVSGSIQTDGNDWVSKYSTSTFNDGKWHQVVMVVTGGNTMTFYVDGNSANTASFNGGTIGSYSNTSNVRVVYDYGDSYTGSTDYYDGYVDDVRIYNRALSASDVDQLYAFTSARYINYNAINHAKINKAKMGVGAYN